MMNSNERVFTPQQALERLLEGNWRFVHGRVEHPNQDAERRNDLVSGQFPYATLFGCADSRIAAEVIFDQGLGDMFVVRTAGHVMESAITGSLEYAIAHLHTPLVVVLGHDSCGAVSVTQKALKTGVFPGGFIRYLVERIIPSAISAHLSSTPSVNEVVREHTVQVSERILEQSRLIAKAVDEGRTAVVGMFYHLADGKVELVYCSQNIDKNAAMRFLA
ncbi:carbonic anhydrase [Rothia sp. CCM 9418]|uniref:carbonic anhydrase n=1 Tax=Rothia sp. CCM 9418 TaxID=3402661 RepID=UPI003ADC02C7